MDSFKPPSLNRDFACIMPDNNPVVGAVISSYFNDPNSYFVTFCFPAIDEPYAAHFDFDDDGYIARMIGSDTAIFINNAIVKLQPKKVFLAGMTGAQKSYIKAHIPKAMIIEVDLAVDVPEKLAFLNKAFEGTLLCKSSDIVAGLLLSKFSSKRLCVYDKAPVLSRKCLHNGKGLVLLENTMESQDVTAVNYAFSIDADVTIVPAIHREQVHSLQRLIYEWKNGSSEAYSSLKQKVTKRVKGINFANYEFATFFTRGLPYGFLLKNIIPFSHVLINIAPDLFIFNNIAYENIPASFDTAVVFSPQLLVEEETSDIIAILENNNYVVRDLLGDKATVKALENYAGHFPYDLMHICSHGGETTGFYVIEEFSDRTGKLHKIEYEEVVGFSPASDGLSGKNDGAVAVTSKAIFRRFDGFAWGSPEIKQMASFIFEDMRKAMHRAREEGVTRVRLTNPIYTSCHIECFDSKHQGDFRSMASHGCPVVFNNTCSSWYEIAICFVQAGTRAYIGTLWKVGSTTARNAAKRFYEDVFNSGNMLFAFHEMVRSVKNPKYNDIYLFWGLHFSTIKKPPYKTDQKAFDALMASSLIWLNKYQKTPTSEIKRNCIPILNFISEEIRQNFKPDHLMALEAKINAYMPNQLEQETEDDFNVRGVMDLLFYIFYIANHLILISSSAE